MHNIILAGVGGQGLVLLTNLISHSAFAAGYDVKSNDVIGLSQRGGMVSGSVRFGAKVHSPNIRPGEGDLLLALEPMEALRWAHMLKPDGRIITGMKRIFSTPIQQQTASYPDEEVDRLLVRPGCLALDVFAAAKELGKKEAANTILLGALSVELPIDVVYWENAMRSSLRADLVDLNLRALHLGRSLNTK
jgi:indolepyruvate ferredoxin oxidoreductase beta subunit